MSKKKQTPRFGNPQKRTEMQAKKERKQSPALPSADAKLYFRLFNPLLAYTNKRLEVLNQYAESIDKLDFTEKAEDGRPILDFHEALFNISKTLWQHPELIDEYIAQNGDSSDTVEDITDSGHAESLTDAERHIILSWKRFVTGKFAVVEHHTSSSTLIDVETNKVYRVKGITDPVQMLVQGFELPVIIQTTLLPFKDVIITSGHVGIVWEDNGASYHLNETLQIAKDNESIITEI